MEFGKLSNSPNWQRLNGQKLGCSLPEAVEKILIKESEAGNQIKVCIGTDSQVKGQFVEFVTVIVFLRKGKGGFMFKHRNIYECKIQTARRMLMEVYDSIDVGYGLEELWERYEVDMEIHADINKQPKFQSNVAFKEAMGYVLGMGFVFVAKPEAYASSSCADKVVKGGKWPKKKVAGFSDDLYYKCLRIITSLFGSIFKSGDEYLAGLFLYSNFITQKIELSSFF